MRNGLSLFISLQLKLFIFCILFSSSNLYNQNLPKPKNSFLEPQVFFSPNDTDSLTSPYRALTNLIQSAEKNIYIVAYELNIYNLIQLLIQKQQSGIDVNIFIEADSAKVPETKFLIEQLKKNNVRVYLDKRKSGIMHNKFIIIDENKVLTGSANFSLNAFFQQFNDVVIINNSKLARKYLNQFFILVKPSYTKKKKFIRKKIEIIKTKSLVHPIIYQLAFSRQGYKVIDFYNQQLTGCKDIRFLIFAFSSKPIVEKMKDCLKKKAKVVGIFDNSFESENITKSWKTIPFQVLWKSGANVKYDNLREKIHHKTTIINGKKVITGSFNFSRNAEKNNDENMLVIQSSKIAKIYLNRFNYLWKKFPSQTLFENYILSKNRKKTKLSFRKYQLEHWKKKNKVIAKALKKQIFSGKVVLVTSGNRLEIELTDSKERITVALAGIETPNWGDHDFHQQPQASLAKEYLIMQTIQRKIYGRWINRKTTSDKIRYVGKNISAILWLNRNLNNDSINAKLLRKGLAYPVFNDTSYTKNKFWKRHLPQLKKAIKEAKKNKRFLWGSFALEFSPQEFLEIKEERILNQAILENQYSLNKFKFGVWIGNRKTLKAYPPNSPSYQEYLKDLNDEKLIFFEDYKKAKLANYFLVNEKNY